MAIRYVDLVNGNDSNNGTTFALRKKTITSASSGLTGGDTVRVMKSSDPTSLGSCTWSNSNSNVILPTAVTAEVSKSQNTNWTVSANVTKANWTSVDGLRIGSNGVAMTIAAAFTTGKVAYAPCTTSDLSGYQQLSFILSNSISIAANSIYIDLCSDSTGDVPVVSLAIPAVTNAPSYAYPITLDYGANLPSGINSIAIRCTSDPGSLVIRFNHIIACKDKTDNSSLTLNSIIGLNTTDEPEWYSIFSIDGTTVSLDIQHNWAGSAGSLSTYKIQPLLFQNWQPLQANAAVPTGFTGPSGTTTALANVEFGWDSTDMSSQTGYTAIDFQTQNANPAIGGTHCRYNRIIAVRSRSFLGTANSLYEFGEYHLVNPSYNFFISGINAQLFADKLYVTCSSFTTGNGWANNFTSNIHSQMYCSRSAGIGLSYTPVLEVKNLNVKNLKVAGCRAPNIIAGEGIIENFKVYHSNATGISGHTWNSSNYSSGNLKIKNMNLYGSVAATQLFHRVGVSSSSTSIENLTFQTTPLAFASFSAYVGRNKVFVQNYNNTNIGKGAGDFYTLNQVTTPVHTAGGNAWEFIIKVNSHIYVPLYPDYYKSQSIKVCDIPVKANKLHTVKLWVQRKFTTTKCAVFVKPEVSGISDYVVSESSAAANTWEELTITFTPTVNSVVPIYFGAQYDATNASQAFYFDDLSVTIAD